MKKALCYKMDQEVFKRLTFLAKVNNLSKTAYLTTLINKNFKKYEKEISNIHTK